MTGGLSGHQTLLGSLPELLLLLAPSPPDSASWAPLRTRIWTAFHGLQGGLVSVFCDEWPVAGEVGTGKGRAALGVGTLYL